MTTPTPEKLAEGLADLAAGFLTETDPGRNPLAADHLSTMAKRIVKRVSAGDTRLAAFAGSTDSTGYVWFPVSACTYLEDAATRLWSFERWFNGLSDVAANAEPINADALEDLREDREQLDSLTETGLQFAKAVPGAGFLLRR